MNADNLINGAFILILTAFFTVVYYMVKRGFENRIISRGNVPQVETSSDPDSNGRAKIPQSVNYHFTRQCNYKCGFCFHTAKTSFVLPLEEAERGLQMLKEAGRY